jgi:hypothetical protein
LRSGQADRFYLAGRRACRDVSRGSVRFSGPLTRVDLEHRGWERLAPSGTFVQAYRLSTVKRLLVIIALLLSACGTVQGPQSHGGPVQDQVSLIDALRKTVTVDISGTISQPFLNPQSGTAVRLSGGPVTTPADVQLFEYGSALAASADAKRISPDGSGTANTKISWVAPPHFFLKGRVMALYVGSDSAVLTLLQSLLGPQFAGR